MYKRQIPTKRQQAKAVESKSSSVRSRTSSHAQPPIDVELPLPSDAQSIESLEKLTPAEHYLSDQDVHPLLNNAPQLSQWQDELREIEWELNLDVWQSCPYD